MTDVPSEVLNFLPGNMVSPQQYKLEPGMVVKPRSYKFPNFQTTIVRFGQVDDQVDASLLLKQR